MTFAFDDALDLIDRSWLRGPDGFTVTCEQTGQPYECIALMAMPCPPADFPMTANDLIDHFVRNIFARGRGQRYIFWRMRPEIEGNDREGWKIRCRVAFGDSLEPAVAA